MKFLNFTDLKARGIVGSRMTLWRLIKEHDFPPGLLISPNRRAWAEPDVDAWLASRPVAPKTRSASPMGKAA